jgi:hypothetical protein
MVTVVATPEPEGPPSRDDGPAGVAPTAHGGEGEVDEELATPEYCKIAPNMVNRDDEAGRGVHCAEDALERVKVPDQPLDRIAAICPGRRQMQVLAPAATSARWLVEGEPQA